MKAKRKEGKIELFDKCAYLGSMLTEELDEGVTQRLRQDSHGKDSLEQVDFGKKEKRQG